MKNKEPSIRLGYACINTQLRYYDVFTSRTLVLKSVKKLGIAYIKELIKSNVEDLFKILIFNEAHGIRFFRISSGLFPHLGNPDLGFDYDINFIKPRLREIGVYAKIHGHRLTMHPGQFVQLGSDKPHVIKQSVIDLQNHVNLLKALGYGPTDSSVLVIHGGGTYGNKQETLLRWERNFNEMPDTIKQYVALENDENSYGIMDLLPVCERLNIPFCLDIFHNAISKSPVRITQKLIQRIFNTWFKRTMIPKIHVSQQQPGQRRGAHSQTIYALPNYLFFLPYMFHTDLDIMLEVKDKEQSVFKIYWRYFNYVTDKNGRVTYYLKRFIRNQILTKL